MTTLATPPKLQFFDANGKPLAGGKLYTYAAGTTTPLATYTDYGGGTANPNPVILDSRGEANVWLGTALYKFKLTTSTNVDVWTVDNVGGAATLAALAASGGSSLVGFLQAGTGAVPTTVQAKLRESVSVKDFGAVGDGTTDDASAVQLAINRVATLGRGLVVFPPGSTYYLNSQINLCDNLVLWGYGAKIKIGSGFAGINNPLFKNFSGTSFTAPGTRLASKNIAFLGFEVDGQDVGVAGSTVPNASMHGAIICCGGWDANTGVDNFVVKDCNMYSFAGAGVMTWHSSNVNISQNQFANFFANTSLSIGSCIDHHDLSNSTITNNRINHTSTGLSWHGMVILDWTTGCTNVVIDGNVITNMNGGDGISCEGNSGNNLTNGIVTNNIIKNCNGQGVSFDNCVSGAVSNNIIDTVTGPAILFTATEELVVVGNKINVSGLGGIVCRSGVVRAVVSDNLIQGVTYFDANYRGNGIEVEDNYSSTTCEITIANNTIKDTAGTGIYTAAYNCVVTGNNIVNSGSSASLGATLRAGIYGGANGIISGNSIKSLGNTSYAISGGASDFPSILNNVFVGTWLVAYYHIGYRGTGINHNIDISIEDARYDSVSNTFIGRYNGTPAGYWYKGDTFYNTAPASAGYIGSVVTTTPSTWKTFGLIS